MARYRVGKTFECGDLIFISEEGAQYICTITDEPNLPYWAIEPPTQEHYIEVLAHTGKNAWIRWWAYNSIYSKGIKLDVFPSSEYLKLFGFRIEWAAWELYQKKYLKN